MPPRVAKRMSKVDDLWSIKIKYYPLIHPPFSHPFYINKNYNMSGMPDDLENGELQELLE